MICNTVGSIFTTDELQDNYVCRNDRPIAYYFVDNAITA